MPLRKQEPSTPRQEVSCLGLCFRRGTKGASPAFAGAQKDTPYLRRGTSGRSPPYPAVLHMPIWSYITHIFTRKAAYDRCRPYHWDNALMRQFLDHLATSGLVRQAARALAKWLGAHDALDLACEVAQISAVSEHHAALAVADAMASPLGVDDFELWYEPIAHRWMTNSPPAMTTGWACRAEARDTAPIGARSMWMKAQLSPRARRHRCAPKRRISQQYMPGFLQRTGQSSMRKCPPLYEKCPPPHPLP